MTLVNKDDNLEELKEKYLAKSHLLGFDSLTIKDDLEFMLRRVIINLISDDKIFISEAKTLKLQNYFEKVLEMFDRRGEIADYKCEVIPDFESPFLMNLFVNFTHAKQTPRLPPENFHDLIELSFYFY